MEGGAIADNVTVDNGDLTDYTVSADESTSGGRAVQRVKLAYSADGSETHAQVDADGVLVNLGANNDVTVTSLALPTGAATAAKQPALGTAGSPSVDVVSVQGVASGTAMAVSDGGASLTVDGTVTANAGSGTFAVSAASLPLPAGAATAAKQPALGAAGSASADVLTVQGISGGVGLPVSDGGGSLTVDGAVSISGTVDTELTTGDLDTGGGTDARAVVGLVGSASGGGQILPGTATDGLLVNLGGNNDVTVTGTVTANAGTGTMAVSAASLPLPSGASTAAKQPSLGTAGSPSSDVLTVQGATSMTALKVDGSAVTQPVSDGGGSITVDGTVGVSGTIDTELTTADLDTGAGTDTRAVVGLAGTASGGAQLIPGSATDGLLVNLGANNDVTVTGTVTANAGSGTLAVSAAALPLPTGAATAVKQPALGTAGTPAADVISVQGVASGTVLPVSAASLPLPSGAATAAKQPTLGTAGTPSADVISIQGVASGTVIPVSDGGGSLTVDGTVTANAGTNLNTSALALEAGGNLAAAATSLSVIDDWDETDRAKVNVIVGQAGVAAGAGAVGATVQRVTLASDDPAVASLGLLDNAIAGNEMQVDVITLPALPAGSNNIGDVDVLTLPALPAGTNNIGDVDVLTLPAIPAGANTIGSIASIGTSITPGTAAANLGKAEDAAHASGDTGVVALAVRRDAPVHGVSADGDYATLNVGASGEQWVGIVGHNSTAEITVTSTGLTVAATAYTSGDVLGGEMSFTNAVRTSGGRATIEGAVLVDAAAVIGAVDLFLFRAASTPAADNAANSWADADMLNCVGVISFPGAYQSALNRVAVWNGLQRIGCAATTLFGVLVTRSDHTFFGAVGNLQAKLHVRYE